MYFSWCILCIIFVCISINVKGIFRERCFFVYSECYVLFGINWRIVINFIYLVLGNDFIGFVRCYLRYFYS